MVCALSSSGLWLDALIRTKHGQFVVVVVVVVVVVLVVNFITIDNNACCLFAFWVLLLCVVLLFLMMVGTCVFLIFGPCAALAQPCQYQFSRPELSYQIQDACETRDLFVSQPNHVRSNCHFVQVAKTARC